MSSRHLRYWGKRFETLPGWVGRTKGFETLYCVRPFLFFGLLFFALLFRLFLEESAEVRPPSAGIGPRRFLGNSQNHSRNRPVKSEEQLQ